MEKHVIYKLTSPSGKVYIGRTVNFYNRMKDHKHEAKDGNIRPIYKAIRKYGWDNFTKEIIDEVYTIEEAIIRESKYINEYNSVKNGYNSTYNTEGPGDIWEGLEDTEQYKEYTKKMAKISSGKNNPMYGKKHTEEAKAAQKQKAKGRFSLPWFISKYGEEIGTQKYNDRCQSLSKRIMARNEHGDFIKKVK